MHVDGDTFSAWRLAGVAGRSGGFGTPPSRPAVDCHCPDDGIDDHRSPRRSGSRRSPPCQWARCARRRGQRWQMASRVAVSLAPRSRLAAPPERRRRSVGVLRGVLRDRVVFITCSTYPQARAVIAGARDSKRKSRDPAWLLNRAIWKISRRRVTAQVLSHHHGPLARSTDVFLRRVLFPRSRYCRRASRPQPLFARHVSHSAARSRAQSMLLAGMAFVVYHRWAGGSGPRAGYAS